MAQTEGPVTKKARLSASSSIHASPHVHSSRDSTPAAEKRAPRLPIKLSDAKALPTLPDVQSQRLADEEYQSIAASGVLRAGLDRSRMRWTGDGILERHWVKPESGKNARPPPANNPDPKLMKSKGQCRIRIEPHIFEADMYVVEKEKEMAVKLPPKQPMPPANPSAYGQPFRAQPTQPHMQHNTLAQNQNTLPPVHPPNQTHIQQPPRPPQPALPRAQAPAPAPQPQLEKKVSPDPVISMLAARASSDPQLKTLMKEVATGNATQDQLRVFQTHIDELTKLIREDQQKKREQEEREERERAAAATTAARDTMRYDGPSGRTPNMPARQFQHPPRQPVSTPLPVPLYQQPHRPWVPPQPAILPVVFSFSTPGASEDRFLFPQYSILESLSPQHLLVSFIVTRKGREAADTTGLDPVKTYWQPITMMVEVAYGREEILNCIRRWVKPPDEVKKHMEDLITRFVRAPTSHLAMRLPMKGSNASMEFDSEDMGMVGDATPPAAASEERLKSKKGNVMYVKKGGMHTGKNSPESTPKTSLKASSVAAKKAAAKSKAVSSATPTDSKPPTPPPFTVEKVDEITSGATAGKDGPPVEPDEPAITESGRPKRAVRKSVRISEG